MAKKTTEELQQELLTLQKTLTKQYKYKKIVKQGLYKSMQF